GLNLTDESHHEQHGPHDGHTHAEPAPHTHAHAVREPGSSSGASTAAASAVMSPPSAPSVAILNRIPEEHRAALWLGTLYALGHGTVVTILGVLAIVAAEVLPDWVDGVMERVVGVTLIFLSLYLFFSLYQYF